MHVYDLAIMIPLGYLALITGVLLSVGTTWGLLKHWWIVTKLVLTIAVLAFAGFFTSGWVLGAVARTAENPMADLGVLGVQLAVNFAAFNVVFWTTTIISIYKPWGPTPRGKRKLAEQAAAKRATAASHREERRVQLDVEGV
jgi:membrane protein implicated in regulation of membrane protease activity